MFGKGNKIYSILTGACPKCHQENMYKEKNAYVLSSTLTMNEKCSNCGLIYQIEPSFFYGSMYVSYAVGIAFAVAAFVISHLVFKTEVLGTFISITATLIISLPIIARLSRNLWINMFVKYRGNEINKNE